MLLCCYKLLLGALVPPLKQVGLGYGQVLKRAAKANGVAATALILTQWLRNPQLCKARPVCVVAQLYALAYLLRRVKAA